MMRNISNNGNFDYLFLTRKYSDNIIKVYKNLCIIVGPKACFLK